MTDKLTMALEEIRERYAARPGDVERLLAAVEKVLELADEWAVMPWPDDGGDRVAVAVEQVRLDGSALRAAIAREIIPV